MKRINQYNRTDRDIEKALLAIMDRKPFAKITVQDILEEAMINRSTFYQHYTDKYAVLEHVQEKCMVEMTALIEEMMNDKAPDMDQLNHAVYQYLAENRELILKVTSIRSETLDMEGRMCRLFAEYLQRTGRKLTQFEAELLAEIGTRFLLKFIAQPQADAQLSVEMMEAYLHMTLAFFRIDHVEGAEQALLQLIGQLRQQDRN